MTPEDIMSRLLNPGVILSMVGAGIAYASFLWALNIRPGLNLYVTAVVPGVVFLLVIWSIRAMQGVPSGTYIALTIDWLIFAHAAFATVLLTRRWRARP